MDIISQFANPETMLQMSTGQKVIAGLIVTVLGMGVTFVALILLSWISKLMSLIVRGSEKKESVMRGGKSNVSPSSEVSATEDSSIGTEDEEELIAVITAAIAASLGRSTSEIVVTNIRRTGDATPVWGQMGRQQQMINRF